MYYFTEKLEFQITSLQIFKMKFCWSYTQNLLTLLCCKIKYHTVLTVLFFVVFFLQNIFWKVSFYIINKFVGFYFLVDVCVMQSLLQNGNVEICQQTQNPVKVHLCPAILTLLYLLLKPSIIAGKKNHHLHTLISSL